MKRLLLILIICISSLSAHAQHFDWVKSYYGPDFLDGAVANEIYGSVMDSEGNIYILGQFFRGARWDDESGIMPFSEQRKRGALIAKFSPNGNLLWHKELYSSFDDIDAYTIKMVGDSALMLYAMFEFPFDHGYGERNELYYFDTLLTTPDMFPQSPDSLQSPNYYNAFITLGLESGNVIEEHFWIPAMVKNDGSLLRIRGNLQANFHQRNYFSVDHQGNIIFIRKTNDYFMELCDTCNDGYFYWSPSDSNISALRILVDGASKQMEIPLEPSCPWNYQIIKFSPHLDSVIASTYVFDSTWHYSYNDLTVSYIDAIDLDEGDNMYLSLQRTQYPLDRIPVKNSDSLAMEWRSCMIRYDSNLMPTGLAQVTASYQPNGHYAGALEISGTYYDTTSHSLFLRGTSTRKPEYSTLNYRGDTLNLMNNACWLRLNADDLSLISYGKARSAGTQTYERTYFKGDSYWWAHYGSFVATDNRVFCQVNFQSNILFQNTHINSPYGMGLFIWDYDGRELAYIDYNSNGRYNEQGYIHLKDSSLWLTGTLTADADFGSIHVDAASNSHAYIAHYTDTAFMTPYVYSDPSTEQVVETEQPICQIYPNPTSDNLFINVTNEQISNVYIISSLGKQMKIKVFGNRVSLSNVPSGIYYLQIITNRNIYQQKIIKL